MPNNINSNKNATAHLSDEEKKKLMQAKINAEIIKMRNDPVYFCNNYCKVITDGKKVDFVLADFQADLMNSFQKNQKHIILKARQMGISTLCAAYTLWLMLFSSEKSIVITAQVLDPTAKDIYDKVPKMWDELPLWLKKSLNVHVPEVRNTRRFKLSNGSVVSAFASTGNSIAGQSSLSVLFIDEAALMLRGDSFYDTASAAVSGTGQIIILSTPRGTGNFFHKKWVENQNGDKEFVPHKLKWDLDPRKTKDPNFKQKEIEDKGVKAFAREYDCNFEASGDTVINSSALEYYFDLVRDPMAADRLPTTLRDIVYSSNEELKIWEPPFRGKRYIVCADVARGDGKDFSAFHVLDIDTLRQCAEYKGLISPKAYGQFLFEIGTQYNDALVVCENANVGYSTLEKLMEMNYENLYYTPRKTKDGIILNENEGVPGFTTSAATRPLIISELEMAFENRMIYTFSERLMSELQTFIWTSKGAGKSKPEAQSGCNDDLVMSLAIGIYVRQTKLTNQKRTDSMGYEEYELYRTLNGWDDTLPPAREANNYRNNSTSLFETPTDFDSKSDVYLPYKVGAKHTYDPKNASSVEDYFDNMFGED